MRKSLAVAAVFATLAVVGVEATAARESFQTADPSAFAQAVAKAYEQTAPGVTARVVGPLELDVRTARGDFKAYLDTVYSLCVRNHAVCDGFVRRQVAAMATYFVSSRTPPSLMELRVTVRPSAYVEQIAAADGGKSEPIAEPLVGDLWIIGVRDEPTTIEMLRQSDLAAFKLDAAGALAVGERNVAATLGGNLQPAAEKAFPGLGVSELRGDDYLASLLALPDLWTPIAERFDGRLYVAAPASDVLMIADGRTKENAALLARYAVKAAAAAKRPISTEVFEWTPTGWEVVDPAHAE